MTSFSTISPHRIRGFSLVELMVGPDNWLYRGSDHHAIAFRFRISQKNDDRRCRCTREWPAGLDGDRADIRKAAVGF